MRTCSLLSADRQHPRLRRGLVFLSPRASTCVRSRSIIPVCSMPRARRTGRSSSTSTTLSSPPRSARRSSNSIDNNPFSDQNIGVVGVQDYFYLSRANTDLVFGPGVLHDRSLPLRRRAGRQFRSRLARVRLGNRRQLRPRQGPGPRAGAGRAEFRECRQRRPRRRRQHRLRAGRDELGDPDAQLDLRAAQSVRHRPEFPGRAGLCHRHRRSELASTSRCTSSPRSTGPFPVARRRAVVRRSATRSDEIDGISIRRLLFRRRRSRSGDRMPTATATRPTIASSSAGPCQFSRRQGPLQYQGSLWRATADDRQPRERHSGDLQARAARRGPICGPSDGRRRLDLDGGRPLGADPGPRLPRPITPAPSGRRRSPRSSTLEQLLHVRDRSLRRHRARQRARSCDPPGELHGRRRSRELQLAVQPALVPRRAGGQCRSAERKVARLVGGRGPDPRFIPNLRISADYLDIRLRNAISSLSASQVVASCYDSPDFPNNQFCDGSAATPPTRSTSSRRATSTPRSSATRGCSPRWIIGSTPRSSAAAAMSASICPTSISTR